MASAILCSGRYSVLTTTWNVAVMPKNGSEVIGGFTQGQGEALPPQIYLTLSPFVFTFQTRKIGSVYSQEIVQIVTTWCQILRLKSTRFAQDPAKGARSVVPNPKLTHTAHGPFGLETTCLPYVSVNPPMSELIIHCYEVVQHWRKVAHLHNYSQFCAWGRIIPIRTFSLDYWQSTSFPHSLRLFCSNWCQWPSCFIHVICCFS